MKRLLQSLAAFAVLASTASSACESEPDAITAHAPIALLVDVQSGQTLYARGAEHRFIPASITKVMSAYVAFELIKRGELTTEQNFALSESAAEDWYRTGSTMFLEPGEEVPVDLLLQGITSVSANDASVVLAEGALGSIENWVARMNETARALEMHDSHFGTPNGWPDGGKTFTSARDLAKLARALVRDHPQLYARYFGKEGLRHNGFAQANHDPITGVVEGADGIKTGFTSQAGHGFLGSAQRDGTRLIMVLGALETEQQRAVAARELMEWGFAKFDRQTLFERKAPVGHARVQNGMRGAVPLAAANTIKVAIPVEANPDLKLSIRYEGPLQAPIAAGEVVAELQIEVAGMPPARVPLVAAESVSVASPLQRIANAFSNWVG
ncbi:D-alanyl-D-alanine carboxypeptidase family protein [Pontixanthobacter aquaemixtae]|uniref:D-alanyl-D-alanine carboxypeptidase family protein n=1 Tax=Pontixanthobacter aquaemixtae TaxID=1958940 RepID=UPI002E253E15